MTGLTLSMLLTIHNRSEEVSRAVATSLRDPGNHPDELVIVLDRPTDEVRKAAAEAYSWLPFHVRWLEIEGEPGWLGPAKAWNTAFKAARGDLYYMISSEVVQDAGNLDRARIAARNLDTAVFGACHNSVPKDLVLGAEPGLLVSTKMPRPLGFIACLPAPPVRKIDGFDETFMEGYWYDDDDFFLRLWKTGINFTFLDSIHGIHIDHERPDLETPRGMEMIRKNHARMLKKHGTSSPWNELPRTEKYQPGKLVWEHP